MDINKLESSLQQLTDVPSATEFIYDLLRAYGQPKASITRLKKGNFNLAKRDGEVLWKKKLFFKHIEEGDLHLFIDSSKSSPLITKHQPRFIVVTDFTTFLAVDTKTNDGLDIPFSDLAKHYDFFLPWAGLEKSDLQSENPADIKAAEKMGRLYDQILQQNPITSDEERHGLNVFLARLLFCYFAEDTEIFKADQFTNAIASHTASDGSDLDTFLGRLFEALNSKDRSAYPIFLQSFPHVNGGLFVEDIPVPSFNAKARKLIIECGSLNWKAINPDIFGSMIQAVVGAERRSDLGLHYTSVANIMKVLDPLFLEGFRAQLEDAGKSKKKLTDLLVRLYQTRVFDPACGCGNFLVIAFKELCKLEIQVFKRLYLYTKDGELQRNLFSYSQVKTAQFYGIELDDFAHEIAKVSLWLAEHQMNIAFMEVFGRTRPTLPLQDGGNIVCGNATQLDWREVCPNDQGVETFLVGNPPYAGSAKQIKVQKLDMKHRCGSLRGYKKLDYIAAWFLAGAEYIQESNSELGFVSTSSICQGEQVHLLWSHLLSLGVEVSFAYQSFKWSNNARSNAGVTCVVIGLRSVQHKPKVLFSGPSRRQVENISPYLTEGDNTCVVGRRRPLKISSEMRYGSKPTDGGNLILNRNEKDSLLTRTPYAEQFVKRYMGSDEFIYGVERWCLWISDEGRELAESVPEIASRLNSVREMRRASIKPATVSKASTPHKFAEPRHKESSAIIVPSVSSERRSCIPMGFLESGTVVSNLAFTVCSAEPYLFGVLSSRMHMAWVKVVGGRMDSRYRYSSTLCYNTFPFPELNKQTKIWIEELVFDVLDARERHPEMTISQMYDPEKMPANLQMAHEKLNAVVDGCYKKSPFLDDDERFRHLMALYKKLIGIRPASEGLFNA